MWMWCHDVLMSHGDRCLQIWKKTSYRNSVFADTSNLWLTVYYLYYCSLVKANFTNGHWMCKDNKMYLYVFFITGTLNYKGVFVFQYCTLFCAKHMLHLVVGLSYIIRKTYIGQSAKPRWFKTWFSWKCVHFQWKCVHIHLICIKCTHFLRKTLPSRVTFIKNTDKKPFWLSLQLTLNVT